MAALAGLFVVSAGVGVGYSWRRDTHQAEEEALVEARFAANQAAPGIAQSIQELAAEVAKLASTPGLAVAFKSGCSLSFAGVGAFSSGHLDVLRPDGSVACSSRASGPRASYAGQRWFQSLTGKPTIHGPLTDSQTGRLALVEAVRLKGGGGVAGFVDLESLAPGLASLYGGPENLELLVTNPEGTEALSRSLDPSHWVGVPLASTGFARSAAGVVRRGVDERLRIYAVATVPGLGWKVYAGYDRARAIAAADSTFRGELSIVALGLLVSTVAALAFSRTVTVPLKRLATAERTRAAGHPPGRAQPSGPAEVALLAEGFNALVASVEAELTQRQAAEDSYRILFFGNPASMWVYDLETLRFLEVNDAAVASYGYSRDEFLAMTIRDIRPPEEVPAMEATAAGAADMERSGPWRHQKKGGEVIEVEITSHSLIFQGRSARFVMAENITQRQAYERQLRDLALRDQLTGLATRAVVLDRAEQVAGGASAGRPAAVVLCGIDRFREVNDAHGHSAGDQVLIEVAARLRTIANQGETLGRVGAADFAFVCDHMASETEAIAMAGRVEGVLAAPVVVDDKEVFVSASTGIVLVDAPRPAEEVLRDALATMHQAKQSGGGRYEVFNVALRERVMARAELASALRHAAERQELQLYYQPEVDLLSGRCRGAEALMRWAHPSRGLVGPAEFIPVAEETGVISALGRWALQEACRQAAGWVGLGVGPPQVAVNLSAQQLAQPDLVSQVTEALDRSTLAPEALCLELTETALMADPDSALATLSALHDLGVQISIDDFGTGYSSLLYLRRYPVDYLKVDRTFVAGLGDGTHDSAIVSGVVNLGHAFGLTVVAEGVETDQQLETLRGMGCDLGQGYLWSRPVPSRELLGTLARLGVHP
jgi:diguanylate cyclase (GGDEF)-like protein/PAS domain S-box-containing protein